MSDHINISALGCAGTGDKNNLLDHGNFCRAKVIVENAEFIKDSIKVCFVVSSIISGRFIPVSTDGDPSIP